MQATHISPFSGSWYPADAGRLERLLEERFAQSCKRTGPYLLNDALGFVTPHAGPAYSGTVATAVYRNIQVMRPERIVVLAFPHHGALGGVVAPDVDAISTPFGEVGIEAGFDGAFPRVAESEVCDHSFEIQLPFLQRAAPQARLTPLYVGRLGAEERQRAADILAKAWQPGVVFLASSDFTHYGHDFGYTPFPVDGSFVSRLRELDHECIDGAGSIDAALFLETVRERGATVCGRDPIGLLLEVMHRLGADDIYQGLLDYQTSGEITRDYNHTVSYAALGYWRREAFDLSAADGEAMLNAATATLRQLRGSGGHYPMPALGSPALQARRGLFVSLHQGEELLGCIGTVSARKALAVLVGEMALSAALEDPRFRPAAQVAGPIDLEISVLSPFRRVRGAEQVCVGRHGIMLHLGGHSGLLLPQVAGEHGWTAEQFLEAVSRKSMLGTQAWKDPKARLYVFEAQVFARKAAA